ncbi:hypothetical protein AB0L83_34755 [Streptomyces sp. NPDC052071]|uniref:hypothetical protein n=1 Tax=Streptomyces sp. NPDC052071 TaxID=3156666 RepID=UPI0034235C81
MIAGEGTGLSPARELEEVVRLADVLEAHPSASDATDAGAAGDIVVTAAGGTWVLDF